jgi:hypothetical protein
MKGIMRRAMKRHAEGILWTLALSLLVFAAMASSRRALLVIGFAWMAATGTVIPLHFYRAWKKLNSVSNKFGYALWVGFETLFVVALVGFAIYVAVPT